MPTPNQPPAGDVPGQHLIRIVGLLIAFGGGYFIYGMNQILEHAADHSETSFTMWKYGAVVAPLGVVFGLGYLIFGERALPVLGWRGRSRTPAGWALFGVLVVAGFLLDHWFNSRLHELGWVWK